MINLWRAEWLKLRKRPANWGIIITASLIVTVVFIIITGVALYNGKESDAYREALQTLSFPFNLAIPITIISALSTFLAVIYISNSIGSEYSKDTWKMILIRRASRIPFVFIKLLSALVFMGLLIGFALLIGIIVSGIGVLILGGDLVTTTNDLVISSFTKSIISILIEVTFYSIFTMIAAIITRSSIGGIVIGIVSSIVFGVMGQFSETLARISPATHLGNIQSQWVFDSTQGTNQIAQLMGYSEPYSPTSSLLIVSGYSVVLLIIGLYLFKKRDIAGS